MDWSGPDGSRLLTTLTAYLFNMDPVKNKDLAVSDLKACPTPALIGALLQEVQTNYGDGPVHRACRISRWLNCQPMPRAVDKEVECSLRMKSEDDMQCFLIYLWYGLAIASPPVTISLPSQ